MKRITDISLMHYVQVLVTKALSGPDGSTGTCPSAASDAWQSRRVDHDTRSRHRICKRGWRAFEPAGSLPNTSVPVDAGASSPHIAAEW